MSDRLYNKKTLLEELEKRGIMRGKNSLYEDEERGLLKPSGFVDDGKRKVPVYDEKALENYIKNIQKMIKGKKVRIRFE